MRTFAERETLERTLLARYFECNGITDYTLSAVGDRCVWDFQFSYAGRRFIGDAKVIPQYGNGTYLSD